MMEDIDLDRLKYCFGSIPMLYDDLRPSYPEAVPSLIFNEFTGEKPAEILEIGTGTGKATALFAAIECKITALDLSQELIDLAQLRLKKYSNITYTVRPFETLETSKLFDIIFSAQAFHWIDQAVGMLKVSQLLKDNGVFALFWYVIRYQASPQLQSIRNVIVANAPIFEEWPDAGDKQFDSFSDHWFHQISSSGNFENPKRTVITSILNYNKERFVNLVGTYAWFQTLSKVKQTRLREQLIEIIGEATKELELPVRTLLITGNKVVSKC
jgi:ubiquinone/menaquinone biosynthesis C-methylase UbiE